MRLAEYIWIDGTEPTRKLRSKTRVISDEGNIANPGLLPEWGFDGSSTEQSPGDNSDLVLKPVRAIADPLRGARHMLVLCTVHNTDGTPHETNTRAALEELVNGEGADQGMWLGFEQEYTLFKDRLPLGWPVNRGVPPAQGPYYCGVGADEAFGRELAELHLTACLDAGLMMYGINAEVMPGQWEFQVGFRPGIDDSSPALQVADDLWLARWMLYRLGENFGITATLHPKPMPGDWNGAGCHTNFSTNALRGEDTGAAEIDRVLQALAAKHDDHIAVYGHDNHMRLTGLHETCDINEFRTGARNRGASIRIPHSVAENGYGYLEDRRPAANIDPYQVATRLLATICGLD